MTALRCRLPPFLRRATPSCFQGALSRAIPARLENVCASGERGERLNAKINPSLLSDLG
jgi:hypothetical protein